MIIKHDIGEFKPYGTLTCGGCRHMVKERTVNAATATRCGCPKAGKWRGRTLEFYPFTHLGEFRPIRPAWCKWYEKSEEEPTETEQEETADE